MPHELHAVLRIPALLLVAATSALAQSAGQSQTPVFRGGVDLVTVDLTAVDSDGNPILGLAPSDVTVLVDGSPRRIASFVYTPPPAPAQRADAVTRDLHASPDQPSALSSSRTIIFVVDPSTLARGDGMQALHAAARFIDRLPATDRVSAAVLPQWETALRFDESREALKDRLLRGSGTGSINTPLDGRRRQDVEYLFNNLATIEGPKQVVLIHGPSREGDFSMRPSDLVGARWSRERGRGLAVAGDCSHARGVQVSGMDGHERRPARVVTAHIHSRVHDRSTDLDPDRRLGDVAHVGRHLL